MNHETMRSPSTSPLPSSPSPTTSPRRKLFLLLALLLALSLLSDRLDVQNGVRHLALLTALSRHPPSLRVFRLLFGGSFMLFVAALALGVWEGNEELKGWVEGLLFAGLDEEGEAEEEEDEVEFDDENDCGVVEDNGDGGSSNNSVEYAPQPSFYSARSSQPATPNKDSQTPTSLAVLGAALDITILTCACLICFTVASAEGGRYIDQSILPNNTEDTSTYLKYFCEATAPLFPLGLFCIAVYKAIFPWKERGRVWVTLVGMTVGAPFYEVTFRDGFIGDIITSAVRPLQDLLFTLFFLPLGLHAYWSNAYTVDAAAIPIERSWIVHTLLLPACTLSPQWWRYCQNLRQCYDAKKRWPYLGNALKYMLAAEVATFGMFDPSIKKHPLWICSFAIATLYQVWWDVFMDWGLLEWDYAVGYFALREERLYKRRWVYYLIFVINFLLRFVGMITLIPPVHLSRTTGLIVNTFPDFGLFVGSLAACAEIFRRTVWALLRFEWEVIKTRKETSRQHLTSNSAKMEIGDVEMSRLEDGKDMKPMAISSSVGISWKSYTLKSFRLSDMSELNGIQILTELCVWATVFSGIAIIAAAHREVL